jgi:hypothetical protein
MRILSRVAGLFRALFHSHRVDKDLADEMRFHIEREAEANIARGMSREDALRAARLTFGSVDASHEQSRDERPGAAFRRIVSDVRFGTRLLAKSPVFAVTAIAIIALGVGAATAIFSVVYGVILRPLPLRDPASLVSIWVAVPSSRSFPTAADAAELRAMRAAFTGCNSGSQLERERESRWQRRTSTIAERTRVAESLLRPRGVTLARSRFRVGRGSSRS